ncbi:histidinol-phosphate aminotransferase [Listeria floridensis FSL S10-1187]|uniref:Histidinol-phosphate aminotransferase n=1 Tax=Listeria floridensis FSL S10-1187 TaxID=1265817 RepID=A0ABN0RGA3_9LIST|nr:histidinol-phosphate aminotransferase [Listeria floridensis FSL S10-1187]
MEKESGWSYVVSAGKREEQVKRELGLEKITKLSSNENPYGASPRVKKQAEAFRVQMELYPDGYATELRSKVAAFYQLREEELIFTSGVDELIGLVARAILGPEVNTVMATPSFVQYRHNARIEGAEVREVALLENGDHDLSEMLAAVDENTAVVWLCSPNNPTGNLLTLEAVEAFVKQIPSECLVVLDEAYIEYVDPVPEPHENWIRTYPNVMITRTFSKIYGLAGARVGYGMADPSIIKQLEIVRSPFNTSVFGQLLAGAALSDQAFVAECRKLNRAGIAQYAEFADKFPQVKLYPSQGNFVLLDLAKPSAETFEFLEKNGYIVRPGAGLGFPEAVRITVGRKEENQEVIRLLEAFLQ